MASHEFSVRTGGLWLKCLNVCGRIGLDWEFTAPGLRLHA